MSDSNRQHRTYEEQRYATSCCLYESQSMGLPLQDGQAVHVWTYAALKDIVAVVQQVVRSDSSCDVSVSFIVSRSNELYCILGSDVLHDYPQGWASLDNGLQHSLDEDRFPVEDIHRRIHHLPVHQQRQIHL